MAEFIDHKLDWEPGQEGKGFIIRPSEIGLKNFPHLADAQPIVWTWPTVGMKPTHAQVAFRTTYEVPQGMSPDKTSYFHIQPDGGVYQFGSGRTLNDDDYGILKAADSNLTPVGQQPQVQSDGYGHANRLLEILGRWREIPTLWREISRR